MSIENVTAALQAFATTGNGLTVTLPGLRFLTFKVQGNGNVTAGLSPEKSKGQHCAFAFRSGRFVFHPRRIVSNGPPRGRVALGKNFTLLHRYMVGRMCLAVIATSRKAFFACFSLHLNSPRFLRNSRTPWYP